MNLKIIAFYLVDKKFSILYETSQDNKSFLELLNDGWQIVGQTQDVSTIYYTLIK